MITYVHLRDAGRVCLGDISLSEVGVLYLHISLQLLDLNLVYYVSTRGGAFCFITEYYHIIGYYYYLHFFALLFMGLSDTNSFC